MTSEDKWIKRWQKILKDNEFYSGKVDGQFGPKTLEASLGASELEYEELVIERKGHMQMIMDVCDQYGLSLKQKAYVLATAEWETARTFLPVKEAYWLSEDWRKRKLRYYPWYGRGFVQLTWKTNYQKASDELGVDFMSDPDLVMDPRYSALILVRGMIEGWFVRGHKLSRYINDSKTDYVGARRMINGTDRRYTIASIALEYQRDLESEALKY